MAKQQHKCIIIGLLVLLALSFDFTSTSWAKEQSVETGAKQGGNKDGSTQNEGWDYRCGCDSATDGSWSYNWGTGSGPDGSNFGYGSGSGHSPDGSAFGFGWGGSSSSGGGSSAGSHGRGRASGFALGSGGAQ